MQYTPQVEIIRNYDNYPFLYTHFIINKTMLDGIRKNIRIEIGVRPFTIVIQRVIGHSAGIGMRIFGVLFQIIITP